MIALRTKPTRSRAVAALLAAPALAMAVAACAPAESPPAADSSPSASSNVSGGPSTGNSSADRDAYDLALAQCMRDRGLDVEDPAPGEGIRETGPEVRAAASACMAEIGPPPTTDFTDAQVQTIHEQQLAVAECLRALGYDAPDPEAGSPLALADVSEADFASCEQAAP